MENKLYQVIARSFVAYQNCQKSHNLAWLAKHRANIENICSDFMPHGSGLNGHEVTLDFERSKPNRLVFAPVDFHHMDHSGMYVGWTSHDLIVTADLAYGYLHHFTGRDRDDIKEYLSQTFTYVLDLDLEWSNEAQRYVEVKAAQSTNEVTI